MTKLVVLKFQGSSSEGFQVTLDIGLDIGGDKGVRLDSQEQGKLLPMPQMLIVQFNEWQDSYNKLIQKTRTLRPSKIELDGTVSALRSRCQQQAKQLVKTFNCWLKNSIEFQPIELCLRENLKLDEAARVLLQTQDKRLHRLPWHQWAFIVRYTQTEIAFAPLIARREYLSERILDEDLSSISSSVSAYSSVKVLAVLGYSENIDTEVDQALLQELPDAEIYFLKNCDRKSFSETLRAEDWQVLFFAGHSETDDKGVIYLNEHDELSLEELQYGLKGAISRGLQIAIFNSCEGLGLAYDLSALNIPALIVMREPIPDIVAQAFLQYFLINFSQNKPLFASVRRAREHLQDRFENRFPCASWLPIIWQNPTAQAATWLSLKSVNNTFSLSSPKAKNSSIWQGIRGIVLVFLTSLFVASMILGIRETGFLQSWELQSYDQLMRWRPAEGMDDRILTIGVTDQDIQMLEEDPLSDKTLLRILQTIEKYSPRVIALDIVRESPQGAQSDYDELIEHLQESADTTVLACAYGPKSVRGTSPPQGIHFDNLGFSNLIRDPDHSVRRHLISTGGDQSSECTTPLSLSFLVAMNYLKGENIEPETVTHNGHSYIQLGSELIKHLSLDSSIGAYHNRISSGYQAMANYRGDSSSTLMVSVEDILSGSLESSLLEDKAVFIGYIAKTSKDIRPTPYGFSPSVVIHSQLASQLVSKVLDHRPLIEIAPRKLEELWIWFWTFAAGIIFLLVNSQWLRLLCSLFSIVLLSFMCLVFLIHGLWIALIPCLLGFLTSIICLILIDSLSRQPLFKNGSLL